MRRARRDQPAVVAFDITTDHDVDDDGGSSPTDPRPGWWERAVDRWRRADRRQRGLVAGVVGGVAVLLVGGAATAATLAAHAHDERLRAAPGGVLSLEGELTEVWRTEGGGGVQAVIPDGGVVLAEGEDVVAIDAGSGEERWRTALGADPLCGPQPRLDSGVEWTMSSDLVTCVHGPAEERAVTVLDAAGDVVGQRELPAAAYGGEDRDVAPAADGGLLVADHDTDMPAVLDYATEDEALSAMEQVDPGEATVHVEDAVTGDVRFEVPTGSSDGRLIERCLYAWSMSETGWQGTFDEATPVRVQASPSRGIVSSPMLIGYQWCDVGGGTSVTGAPLAGSGGGHASTILGGVTAIGSYPADRFVVPTTDLTGGEIGSALVDQDGSVLLESSTLLVVTPGAWVDADHSVVLATDGFGQTLAGLDPAGEELWRLDLENPTVLGRAGDVAVVAGNEDLVAVDVTDGTERWRVALNDPQGQLYAWPTSAVTDGERVMIALTDTEVGELLTVDLATGTATREKLGPGGAPYLSAVDGTVLLQRTATPTDPWTQEPEVTSVSILAPR